MCLGFQFRYREPFKNMCFPIENQFFSKKCLSQLALFFDAIRRLTCLYQKSILGGIQIVIVFFYDFIDFGFYLGAKLDPCEPPIRTKWFNFLAYSTKIYQKPPWRRPGARLWLPGVSKIVFLSIFG